MLLLTCAIFLICVIIISLNSIDCSVSNSTSLHSSTLSSTTSALINPHSLSFTIRTPSYSTPTTTFSSSMTSKTISLFIYSVAIVKTADQIMTAVRISSIMTLLSITISMNVILYSTLSKSLLCYPYCSLECLCYYVDSCYCYHKVRE